MTEQKKALRVKFLSKPHAAEPETARHIIKFLREQGRGTSVFCYCSVPGEPPTDEIIDFCLANGYPLGVPLCGARGTMTARRIQSRNELAKGRCGIPEPPDTAPIVQNPQVILVPGVAFAHDGARLGRGGGYYDRYLAGRGCITIGMCHASTFVPELPSEPWDVKVGSVALPEGLWNANN